MPKASPIQTSFNAGELSPRLEGRVDLPRYKNGCQIMENFIPSVHGSVSKRPGTRYVNEVKTSSASTILIPFEYNTETAYVIELGNLYARFYANGAFIGTSEIATPWSTADLSEISYAQSADRLYVVHPNYEPRTINRITASLFSLGLYTFSGTSGLEWPPFLTENTTTATLYASAATGVGITITASSSVFESTMVGGYLKFREIAGANHDTWTAGDATVTSGDTRIYEGNVYVSGTTATTGTRPPIHISGTESDGAVDWTYRHSGEGFVDITGFTSSTVITATVVSRLPDSVVGSGNATVRWSESSWSDHKGWPKSVCFYEDRLVFAGSTNQPQTIWGSVVGDYNNHRAGTIDDSAYQFTLNSDQVNVIEWMSPGRALMVGTAGAEFTVSGSTLDEAITPTNVRAVRVDTKGSKANVRPIRIGSKVLFIQRSGRKLREIEYVFENDGYRSPDLTLLAEHITLGNMVRSAYQQEPDQLFWIALNDGQLICMTYEDAEQVIAWHRHPISGTNAKVESIASIPHPDGDQDQLWMIVNRTINGATKRYVEYLEKDWISTNDIEDAFFVDSGATYDGAATTTISGLAHLEGETVTVLADGMAHNNKTVSSGSITLDRSASVVQVGLGYNATLQTMRFDAGAADGTSQGKTKRITDCSFRMYETGAGLWFGPTTSDLEELQFRDSTMAMDQPIPLFSGDKGPKSWPSGYELDARVTLQHKLPLPCTITAIMPQMVTQDR